ncbi:carbohydrate ABC transporter permease [Jiangella ureilytica]|uniref:Carbohydrate ABC transporter permease n=1 Tax=Jiangella ureilytica TaxID=2530374 RepID=A0A4V6PB63_9ACTN|nr:carbohydrate ABC transporter permease [Jiangella ureilytica]TDC53305.1 carbohydrate ABC transporter permease [Jiangella ureilytica]
MTVAQRKPLISSGTSHRPTVKKIAMTSVVAVIAIAFLIPFYWLLVSSLREPQRIFADAGQFFPSSLTLQNFRTVFNETPVVSWFANSVILTVGSTVGSLVVVTMAAYALAQIRFPFRNTIFVSILASQMLPFHLLLIPLFLLMIQLNLIDTHLGVIVPMLAHPFGLFYMRQYMLGLPQAVFDAARVDGASDYRIFFRIVLPMVKPALATLAIIFALEQWNDLLWPLIVMRSEGNYPLSVGMTTLVGLYRPRWDLVIAVAVIAVVPIMLMFVLLRKQFINGLGQFGTGTK